MANYDHEKSDKILQLSQDYQEMGDVVSEEYLLGYWDGYTKVSPEPGEVRMHEDMYQAGLEDGTNQRVEDGYTTP
jgi:hypothetical protein